jgi:hypothetical protein
MPIYTIFIVITYPEKPLSLHNYLAVCELVQYWHVRDTLETKPIPVTIDKSHLITIGEKLYTEKVSFVRELVNNAYDADAIEVHVTIVR